MRRDYERRVGLEYLGIYGYVGPAKWKWKKRMRDGWRDRKEPRQTIQKKDNASSNNELKKEPKNGRQKEGMPSAKKIVS